MVGLPWVPACLRFIRVARQWLLLCLGHPRAQALSVLASFAIALVLQLRRSVAGGTRKFGSRSFVNSDMFARPNFESTLVREYVSLFGLLTSCVAGRALLRAVGSDRACDVTRLLKPVPQGQISAGELPPPDDTGADAVTT